MKDRCSEKQVLGYVLTVGVTTLKDDHQVGDEKEVEVLCNFNWLPRELITKDGVLPEKEVIPSLMILNRSMDSNKYLEGQSMQRPPLFESDHFIYWKNRFETYVKAKDLDLWHIILNGDFLPVARNKETQVLETVPFEQQDDDLKKKLAKNNEAKMVLYNALPKKEYKRIFMCKTAKDIWQSFLITHQGNSQVKDNKIDLLVQQFSILEEESINSGFARFNTIITSLKALDEAKVTAIEELKDLSSLALDELIENLKVHEVVMEKDFKIYKGKKERIKSIALKAKKDSSDDETLTFGSDDEEYVMAVRNFKKFFRRKGKFVQQPREEKKSFRQRDEKKGKSDRKCFRCGDPNHLIGDCLEPSRNKDQKAFIGGSWSDSENDVKDKTNDETCLMAQSSNECQVLFTEDGSEIIKDGKVIGNGIRNNGLYIMKLGNKSQDKLCLATVVDNSTLWHRRLGHANMRLIQSLSSKELVRNLPKLKYDKHFCDACKIGKQAHTSHKAKNMVSTKRCLDLLHMDLFGPLAIKSYGGNLYTLVVVDDYSRYTLTIFLKTKNEAFEKFEILSRNIQNQLGSSIITIRTDHGREFDNEVQFGAYCDALGITHNFSAPRTPQLNGVVERKNMILQEMFRTMLNEQSIPQKFWCNAIDKSTYILNRILIRTILGKTSYEIFRGRKPSLEYFKVFESKCFILNTKDYLTKFDPKSYEGVFLGYSQNRKAYVVLNKHTMKVEESLNVTFDESPPPTKLSPLVDDDVGEVEAIRKPK
ncbi:retrovirus-related pol polyprotein from transposon TNT 1-94 [Tanacetum coccineum]|uniref:Retrovirus-related pol polyprotein from transposon TNT 1-94 n=1 Tax=Tanacetum coccineum TaxID=301880 RepID=A0ABQ4XVK4_9ASTR